MRPCRIDLARAFVLITCASFAPGALAHAPAPVQTLASAPAKEIVAARAAVEASPLDCAAVTKAFTALSQAGRQPGDVEVVVLARRTGAPCAESAADAAVRMLEIPQQEVVAWVLSHPESAPPAQAPELAPETEPGVPLDCGLLFIDRRIDDSPGGARLILTFRNKTDHDVLGHDIVLRVNGQPWRSLVLPRGDEPDQPPLGAAEALGWDTSTGSWQDRRMTESKSISWPAKKEAAPLSAPVEPGGTFDVIVRVEGLTAETEAGKLEIGFDSCVLR